MIGNPGNVQNEVVKYLDEAQLMQIVTLVDEKPWPATVFFAADNRHYLYWLSPASTRHSRNVERNNQVSGTITVPHQYGQPQRGLQFEGLARRVPKEEIEAGFQSFAERYSAHHRLAGLLGGEDYSALYQVVPTVFVLYDEEHFPTQPRQEWDMGVDVQSIPAPSASASVAEDVPYNPLNDV